MHIIEGLMSGGGGGSSRVLHLRSCGTRSLNSLTALN